jgi:hypothetical protein
MRKIAGLRICIIVRGSLAMNIMIFSVSPGSFCCSMLCE